ncbi:MAG: RidA family protein [Melioribacteraceae bacterium]|nr:RidA family protein [Melioribacteraceae bacterium]
MTKKRINISSNSPWEDIVGYSRAVKIDNHVFVSGTTAIDNDGNITGVDNPYAQTKQCIENINIALSKAGANLNDVVRLRIFVVNIDDWEIIGKALGEYFLKIKPAATMVEVNRLITPDILVEIEADAYIQS